MINPTFPRYQTEEIARKWGCFSCCKPLTEGHIKDSGYPPGRGMWQIACPSCKTYTFFDLVEA